MTNRGSLLKISGNYLAIALLAIAMATAMLPVLSTAVQAAAVDLLLLPASQTIDIGNTLVVDIQVKCNGQEIYGIDAFLDFNPAHLEVQTIEGGGVLDTLQNQYDNKSGAIDYSAGRLTPPWPSNTFILASITFKTKSISNNVATQINFHTTNQPKDLRTTMVDHGGNVTGTVTGATVIIQNKSVTPTATNIVPIPTNSTTTNPPIATTPAQGATFTPAQTTPLATTTTPIKTTTPATTTAPLLSTAPTTATTPIQTPGSTATVAAPSLTLTSPTTGASPATASLPQTVLTNTTPTVIPLSVPATASPPPSTTNWNLIVGIIGGVLLMVLVFLIVYERRIRK
jgi:hypothetical protein